MDKLKPSHHLLHAFCIRPADRFETQHPEETVILVLRAHPFTQIPWIVNSFILFVILIILNFFLPSVFNTSQIIFGNVFGFACIFAYIWFNFLSWFFNVGIVTNERIIDVDFHSVIYKEVTEALLKKVEDVTVRSGGFFSSLFNYGHIFVQTAGTEANVEFYNVPQPAEATKIISDLTERPQ